jgi:hypothetical protein
VFKNIFPVDILGNLITPTDKVRNLGVIFDSEFSFSAHVTAVCKACYYYIRDIARIRKFLPKPAVITLSNALVSSSIDYCNSLLNSLTAADLNRLQSVQNSLAYIVVNKTIYCHITPLLGQLHWLPVKHRIDFKLSLLVFKTIKFGSPMYFNDCLIPYTSSMNTRRCNPTNKVLCTVPYNRSVYKSTTNFEAAFSVCGPLLWNAIPLSVRLSNSVFSFRRGLKTYLFRLAFPP